MTIKQKIEDALDSHIEAIAAHLSGWTPEVRDALLRMRKLGMGTEQSLDIAVMFAQVGLTKDDAEAIVQDIARGDYTPTTWPTWPT